LRAEGSPELGRNRPADFSLNYTEADFAEVTKRFVTAAEKMKADGWWWHDAALTNKKIRRQILKEMIASRFGR